MTISTLKQKNCFAACWMLLLGLLLAGAGQAQSWELVERTVADEFSAGLYGLALAPNNDMIVLGGVSGTTPLGNIPAIGSRGSYTNGFIAKYEARANRWQWANYLFTPPGGATVNRALVLPDGDVLVLGTIRGGYAGTSFSTFPTLNTVGIYDGFVARLHGATGQGRWIAQVAARYAADLVQVEAMALTANGELVVTGWFRNELVLGNLPPVASSRPGRGGSADTDIFVARLDVATGRWLQGFSAGGQRDDYATDLAALPNGEVVLAGYGQAPLTLGNLPPQTAAATSQAFVARLNPVSQQWRWVASAVAAPDSLVQTHRLATFPNGDIAVSGKFSGTVQVGAAFSLSQRLGRTSTLVGRIRSTDGAWLWAAAGAGTNRPMGSGGLQTTPAGNVVITGNFSGKGRFGQLPEVRSGSAGPDMFVAQLAGTSGRWQWVSLAGGDGTPNETNFVFADDDAVGDVRVIDNQHLLLCGLFCRNARLGEQIGPLTTKLYDGFLARVTVPAPCPDSLTAPPGIHLLLDSLDCQTFTRTLRVTGAPAGSAFEWSTGATGPSLTIREAGNYQVKVSTLQGCVYRLSYNVATMAAAPAYQPPNIITPNWDGLNDNWVVPGLLVDTQLRIYNRWGQLVYHTASYASDWSAAGLAAGLYYYLLENEKNCAQPRMKGWIEVVR